MFNPWRGAEIVSRYIKDSKIKGNLTGTVHSVCKYIIHLMIVMMMVMMMLLLN